MSSIKVQIGRGSEQNQEVLRLRNTGGKFGSSPAVSIQNLVVCVMTPFISKSVTPTFSAYHTFTKV